MSSLLNPLRRVLLIALIGLSFAPLSLPHAQAATFTVTNCNDSGQGSLRQAISDANTSPGSDTIEFNVTCSPITLVSSGFPTITDNLTILGPGAGNLAIDGAGQYGVFVIESGVSVTLSGLTIQNAGSTAQSAVRNIGGNLTVQACVFKDNVTASTGGAIRNQDNSTLTIADTTFSNNSARDGAAIYNSETLNISNSTFSNNTAGEYGGAINHQSGTATITNSTFTGNSTGCFGGAISTQGTLILIHSTLSTNTSDHRGGGIDQMGGTMTVRNSIVAGNTAATFPDMRVFNADASDNIIGTDPMLGPLADNGGPTQTMMPLPGSPAIDSAASADCQPADQRGVTRPLDGDMDGTPACDIGAVEAPGPLTPVQVQSITRADASPTNASDVRFTVTFDAPVTGVTASYFTLTTSGLTGALISSVSGLATTWTVTAATGTGDGTLRLDMIYAAGVSGPGGVPVVNVPFTTGETYTIDKTVPTVTLSSAAPDPTNTAPIPVAVTFSEAVTGFEAIDLVVSDGTVSDVTGSGTSFTFDLTPIADGLVRVDILAGVAQDTAGNGNTAAATQLTRTYDSTAPTVALSSTAPDPTNTAPIQVTVTFSEAVTGFEASDLTISNGTVTNFTGSGASYGFDVTPVVDGLVTVSVPAGVAQDAAGNTNTAATQLTRTYDSTAPTVTVEQATTQADPTNAAPV